MKNLPWRRFPEQRLHVQSTICTKLAKHGLKAGCRMKQGWPRIAYLVEGLELTTTDFFAESGTGAVASINVPLLSDWISNRPLNSLILSRMLRRMSELSGRLEIQ